MLAVFIVVFAFVIPAIPFLPPVAGTHSPSRVQVRLTAPYRLTLVDLHLAAGHPDLNLYATVRGRVELERYKRKPLLLLHGPELENLALVGQKPSGTKGVVVEPVAEVVRREIGLKEPKAPVIDMHIRADEADAAVSDDLDLRADKRDADLKPRKDRIVMKGPAIARK